MSAVAGLRDVSKSFAVGDEIVTAVDSVTFGVAAGEFACIYGASGSGKTTMLNILAGIDTADSGEAFAVGQSLSGCSENVRADVRLQSIGVVFQSNNLLPEFTAQENIVLPLLVRGRSRAEAHASAAAALSSLGMSGSADRFPERMSGGQRQRVGIARAVAGEQELLLADEPTGALDATNSQELFELMRDLCNTYGRAVVLATHDPLAREVADSVYGMVDGVVTKQ